MLVRCCERKVEELKLESLSWGIRTPALAPPAVEHVR